MKQYLLIAFTLFYGGEAAYARTVPVATPQRPSAQSQPQQRQPAPFDVSEYGVDFQADPRLIVVMAALEAAGFDPIPAGREPGVFRSQLRKDLAGLDPDLRSRLQSFYERNKLPAPATAADQASRYVSLALTLGPPPTLDAPERSEDLPAGLLDVLDFASLVKEFYRRSGIDEKLVSYVRAYQAEGDRLHQPATEMVRALLSYLHTRPITNSLERVEVKTPSAKKKNSKVQTFSVHERARRFLIMPDLLAAPGTINFRIIGDDYYAIVPEGTDPASSELRRAYLEYVIDPLVLRFNKDVAARREQIRQLLSEREKAGTHVTPDVFLSVSRSLVAAADARYEEVRKLEALSRETRRRLGAAKDEATRSEISKTRRPAEYAEPRRRAMAARQARLAARKAEADPPPYSAAEAARTGSLVKELAAIEDTLRLKDYSNAETRLKGMLRDYPREPRIFFALAQTASLAASDATDEQVQSERLNRAMSNYRLAIEASSPETDRAIMSRAHESMGRINAFLENKAEAAKEFDEAIKMGDIRGGAYREAIEGKKKLLQPE